MAFETKRKGGCFAENLQRVIGRRKKSEPYTQNSVRLCLASLIISGLEEGVSSGKGRERAINAAKIVNGYVLRKAAQRPTSSSKIPCGLIKVECR